MIIRSLRTNHLTNPLGFAMTAPTFTWTAESDAQKQASARIQIALTADFSEIFYDSGVRTKSLSHSYLGALKGLAVCEGYTELFFLLVCSLTDGYTPYRATGYIAEDISAVPEKGPGHSWLILRENASKQTWHCDPTWDLGSTQPRYFMKTDREMSGRIWATKYMPPCKEKFSRKIYTHKETLARLVAYYKSMPQRFESGDFTVL